MAGSGFPQVESVDIVHRKQKIGFVSDLHLGTKESLVFDFSETMREEKPEILLFLGDTLDIMASDFELLEEQAKTFFNLIYELGCEVFPVYGGTDKSLSALTEQLKRIAYDHEVHPNVNFTKFIFSDEYQHLYHIFKFYIAAREGISIRSAKGKMIYAAYGPTLNFEMPSIERVDEILKERRCDCLVLGGYHRKSIIKDRFFSLGAWQAPTRAMEGSKREVDLRGALFLDSRGVRYQKIGK
jgi:UDP-2,3-diacylglucosamine pyrophosphatase LpxH